VFLYAEIGNFSSLTLLQAVLAKRHGAKFIVAAPRTSIDLTKESGDQINIEERAQDEVTLVKGPIFDGTSVLEDVATVSLAPRGINVWNPAFDVTPAELIDAIVTESGVVEKDSTGNFPLRQFFAT
jgi:methylthioribose-1-phosphate isomerase